MHQTGAQSSLARESMAALAEPTKTRHPTSSSARQPGGKTPVAVAIQHEPGSIPTVIASGRGATAEQILEIAFASGVKVREDADLAQFLSVVELDCPIPVPAFEAVAEILNYLYRLNAGPAPLAAGGPPSVVAEGAP